MTTAKGMFGVVKKAFTFSIGTKLSYAIGIGNLLLLNKSSIALTHLARDYFKLRHWVGVIEEAAVCMRAHCASAKQSATFPTKNMENSIFFCINNCVVIL
jgi:hypothetical protein